MDSLSSVIRALRGISGGSMSCGWMCDEVASFLHALVRFTRPDVVIQTGHLWGKSAAAILEAFAPAEPLESEPQTGDKRFAAFVEAHRPIAGQQRLISIDPHPLDVPHPREGVQFLSDRYGRQFEFVKRRSDEFFRTFRPEPDTRIFGIVDGDHSDAGCRADLDAFAKLNAETILVDDVLWLPSLLTVSEAFARDAGYGICVHRIYNGIAVLTRA